MAMESIPSIGSIGPAGMEGTRLEAASPRGGGNGVRPQRTQRAQRAQGMKKGERPVEKGGGSRMGELVSATTQLGMKVAGKEPSPEWTLPDGERAGASPNFQQLVGKIPTYSTPMKSGTDAASKDWLFRKGRRAPNRQIGTTLPNSVGLREKGMGTESAPLTVAQHCAINCLSMRCALLHNDGHRKKGTDPESRSTTKTTTKTATKTELKTGLKTELKHSLSPKAWAIAAKKGRDPEFASCAVASPNFPQLVGKIPTCFTTTKSSTCAASKDCIFGKGRRPLNRHP